MWIDEAVFPNYFYKCVARYTWDRDAELVGEIGRGLKAVRNVKTIRKNGQNATHRW